MALIPTGNPIFARRPEDAQREVKRSTTLRRASKKRELLSALHSRNALKEIEELPGEEETLHIIARGNFPLWSLVPAVLKLAAPARVDRLCIATLGFSASNVQDLMKLFDAGQIGAVSIVASVYFERQNAAEYRQMSEGLGRRGQRIAAVRSHAKIITLALSDGRRIAVESSANLRSCRNIEQITITSSRALHDFHAAWIEQVITAAAEAPRKTRGKAKA